MFQDSISYRERDMRRHRRFAFPSRASLLYLLVLFEGVACAAILMAASWALHSFDSGAMGSYLPAAIAAGVVYAGLAVAPAHVQVSCAGKSRYATVRAVLALLVAIATADVVHMLLFPSFQTLAFGWGEMALGAISIAALRFALYRSLRGFMQAGRLQIERVALIGKPELVRRFQSQSPVWQYGGQIVGTHAISEAMDEVPEEFIRTCIAKGCESVLFVGTMEDHKGAFPLLSACRHYAINVGFAPVSDDATRFPKLLDVLPFGPAHSARVQRAPLGETDRVLKRGFDLVLSFVLLLTLLPLLLVIGLLVKFTSPGPVFYWQERRGFNGQVFWMVKFRSMSVMEDGRDMTPVGENDPRITPIGQLLRRTSLDELPQLLNVLRGDMSLVGPRPHALSDDAALSRRFALYARRQRVLPGITGWAQVNGYRGDTSTQERVEGRTLHDLHYIDQWSLGLDIRILLLTAFSRKTRQHAR